MNPIVFSKISFPYQDKILKWYNFLFEIDKRDLFLSGAAILIFVNTLTFSTNLVYSSELINKETLMNSKNTGIILYDRHGTPFFGFYQAKPKEYIPLDQIPMTTRQAVISSEDKDFYEHNGFSVKAIVRSAVHDIQQGETAYGGSTITQQLVKNSLLNSKKNFLRKYQEVVLAEKVEKQFTKDEILEMYLNSAYFGEGAFGIGQATQTYFGKHPRDLTIAESAMLVALLPSPSRFSPLSGDEQQAKLRQVIVLNKMTEQGYITSDQKQQAIETKLSYVPKQSDINQIAPHFALMVKDALIAKFGEEEVERSGFKVYTTLDLNWQEYAEKTTKQHVLSMKSKNANNAAVVVQDPKTGEIKALVGSYDWYDPNDGKVNAAIAPHQPGSSFKPIVYLAGFEKGAITTSTILQDKPTTFAGNYKPKNYDGRFRGPVLVRRALANSLNVPAVSVISKVGVENTMEMARRLGISNLQDPSLYGPSLALGAGETSLVDMTNAYATLANQGVKNEPTLVTKIVDKSGQVVFQHQPTPKQVANPQSVYLVTSILSDNKAKQEVFGNTLNISRPAAVKTGTTDDYKDALTIGYTPSLTIGVWLGNNDRQPMSQVAGSLGAAPLWKQLMEHYLDSTAMEEFNPPSGMMAMTVCKYNGLPIKTKQASASSTYTEYFIQGTQPTQECTPPTPTPTPTDPNQPSPTPTPQLQDQPPQPPQIEIQESQGGPGDIRIIINDQEVREDARSEKKERKQEQRQD